MRHKIICGHVLDVLKTMPDESVDCIVTSPPYWKMCSYLPDNYPTKDKEIGEESTLNEYILHLLEVTHHFHSSSGTPAYLTLFQSRNLFASSRFAKT